MKRGHFLRASASAAALASAPVVARGAATQILVGYWPIAAALPFFVADKMGYFKAAGADVQLVEFADQVKVSEALLAGRINATATGTGSTQLALAQVAQPNLFEIVAANLSSKKSILDEIIVAKDAPYKSIAELKGKKIATGVGPQALVEAKLILEKNGIDEVPIELSPAEHIAAIASGQIDAAYTYEPNGTIGRLKGITRVLESGVRSEYMLGNGDAPWYGGAAVVTTDLVTKSPDAVKMFLSGMKRGFKEVRTNPQASRAIYPAYTKIDATLAQAIPEILYTVYDEFTPGDIAYFQKNFDLFYAQKVLTGKLDVKSMLYRS